LLVVGAPGLAADFEGKVIAILDGDTIEVLHEKKTEHRLQRIGSLLVRRRTRPRSGLISSGPQRLNNMRKAHSHRGKGSEPYFGFSNGLVHIESSKDADVYYEVNATRKRGSPRLGAENL
jgi:hypothetical protein